MATMVIKGKKMKSVAVDWKEFYYTNCPLISASNVDQELGCQQACSCQTRAHRLKNQKYSAIAS